MIIQIVIDLYYNQQISLWTPNPANNTGCAAFMCNTELVLYLFKKLAAEYLSSPQKWEHLTSKFQV